MENLPCQVCKKDCPVYKELCQLLDYKPNKVNELISKLQVGICERKLSCQPKLEVENENY